MAVCLPLGWRKLQGLSTKAQKTYLPPSFGTNAAQPRLGGECCHLQSPQLMPHELALRPELAGTAASGDQDLAGSQFGIPQKNTSKPNLDLLE